MAKVQMTEDDLKVNLSMYITAAQTLSASVHLDIIRGKEYSTATVLALSRYTALAHKIETLLALLESENMELN